MIAAYFSLKSIDSNPACYIKRCSFWIKFSCSDVLNEVKYTFVSSMMFPLFSFLHLIYRYFTYCDKHYRLDTTLIGFPSMYFFIYHVFCIYLSFSCLFHQAGIYLCLALLISSSAITLIAIQIPHTAPI